MPANLPPQYFETEKKLKTARTPQEKLDILEELLSIVPKHKGTEKLQALLKTKISKLKSSAQKKPTVAKHGLTHHIEKAGAGQVVLIGPPNAGKSQLIKSLTNANPDIGSYAFTTHSPYPAMMKYENIQIQLIDTPPITPDFIDVWHTELIKGADGVLLLLDLAISNPIDVLETLLAVLKEKRIEFIGEGQKIPKDTWLFHKRALVVANKKDVLQGEEKLNTLRDAIEPKLNMVTISAVRGDGLEDLRNKIFSLLEILRVYSKVPGKKVDLADPFTLRKGSSVMDMAKAVHKDFAQNLKYARIWSKSKYQGQKVNRDYLLEDEDIIELHI
jgi:ribosome-interacting GTPase 1